MKIPVFQVDAFTSKLFEGNPAAVCPLEEWPEDNVLQQIAMENNLSETAFFVRSLHDYELRWFTPKVEVALCGHATLATAHVLFHHMGCTKNPLVFKTRKSGELQVKKDKGLLTLNFPADKLEPAIPPEGLIEALGKKPEEIWKGKTDYLLYYPAQEDIEEMTPDFSRLADVEARGVIVTAPGYNSDFVSRFFAPAVGVNEDPVTGSAHTSLTPFWAHRMNQLEFEAIQLSERGGKMRCHLAGDRVLLSGQAKTFLEGTITL